MAWWLSEVVGELVGWGWFRFWRKPGVEGVLGFGNSVGWGCTWGCCAGGERTCREREEMRWEWRFGDFLGPGSGFRGGERRSREEDHRSGRERANRREKVKEGGLINRFSE